MLWCVRIKKAEKTRTEIPAETASPGLACGCSHSSPSPTQCLIRALCYWVSLGADFPPSAFCALLEGLYSRRGKLRGFLFSSGPGNCCQSLLVLPGKTHRPAYATTHGGASCSVQRHPPLFGTPLVLVLLCHPCFIVLRDEEEGRAWEVTPRWAGWKKGLYCKSSRGI